MNIIKGPRGTGKTKQLIEFAEKTGAVIVCENVNRMIEKCHGYGKIGLTVISYADYLNLVDLSENTKYCIDDMESFCAYANIKAFTIID